MAVYLQIGQCGVQIGNHFWRNVKSSHRTEPFELPNNQLPYIQIDSNNCSKPVVGHSSCGTWSNGHSKGKHSEDHILNDIRKMAEKFDCFVGLILIHSLAGGLGSGLTSHLMECLRDEYPLQYILNITVYPFTSGESPLQHYNSLLTVPYLQEYSDTVMVFDNDTLLGNALKSNNTATISMMNDIICNTMLSCMLPAQHKRCFIQLADIIRCVAPLKEYKFATCNYVQQARPATSWDHLLQCVLSTKEKRQKLLSSIAILCSTTANIDNAKLKIKSLEKKFKEHYTPVEWNPYPVDFWFRTSQLQDKSLTTLTNSSSILKYLTNIREKATLMHEYKAYLHWYNELADFESSFNQLDTLIQNYSLL